PGLRQILQGSLYGESVTGASVIDRVGTVVAASDSTLIGRPLPPSDDLEPIVKGGPSRQLQGIYSTGRTLEVRQALILRGEPFGSIRVGVSTLLMRSALSGWLTQTLIVAVVALVVAVLVAGVLSERLLRPIHVIRSGLTRLGRGEFGVTLDL